MFRFLLRLCGLVLLAGGFVSAVIDGARSIANGTIMLTPLSDVGLRLFGERYLMLQPAVERNLHPLLWDPVLVRVVSWPAWAVAFGLAFLLLLMARPRPEPIGHYAGR